MSHKIGFLPKNYLQSISLIFGILVLIFVTTPSIGAAQENLGLTIVQTALDLANQNCNALSRNQACYGHIMLSANPRPNADSLNFADEGDIEDLAKISSLRLNGLDLEAGTWGVALMQLRANLPATAAENVNLIVFGDVELENAVQPPTTAEIEVNINQNLNVRQFPSTDSGVIGALAPGQVAVAVERLADSSWVRVLLPDTEQAGWVSSDLIRSNDSLANLNAVARNSTYYSEPMQAFYFTSGADDPAFSEIPGNGLIIQTPEGVGEVQLLINEINIQLGSTVFFQAQPGNQMTVSTLEGHADVRAFGVEQTAYAGTQVTIPLTQDMKPSGPPSPPQPYNMTQIAPLPIGLLERSVTAAVPLTFPEIQNRINQDAAINGDGPSNSDPGNGDGNGVCCPSGSDGNEGVTDGSNPSTDSCPGQSCNAPGQGGSCPGNSCNAPGQNKDKGNNGNGNGKNN